MNPRIIAASLLLAAAGCSQEIPQPDRVRYGVSHFEWRKGEGDNAVNRLWSPLSRTMTGAGFPPLQEGGANGAAVDLDWRLKQYEYLNMRFAQAAKNVDYHRGPFDVNMYGTQTTFELGWTKEWDIKNNNLFFITPRLGYYDQDTGGTGNVGGFRILKQDFSKTGLYGGVEAGVRFSLKKPLKKLGWTINGTTDASIDVSAMYNYEQAGLYLSFTLSGNE